MSKPFMSSKYVVLSKDKPCCKDTISPKTVQQLLESAESQGLTFLWMYVYSPSGCWGSGSCCPKEQLIMIFERPPI